MSRRDDDETLIERSTHDLLNPIASILGLAETIGTRGGTLDDATLRQFGEAITRQASRLERSIRDLATTTRLTRSDPAVAVESVDVAAFVSVVAAEIGEDRVRGTDISEGATVRADPILLREALRRLLSNALEHSRDEVLVGGGAAWLEVTDRGSGFTREGLARAFEPLSAGANSKGERGDGLGVGLYIARRLVEAMGGTLTARSSPGEGSVFRIELPG